MLNRPCAPLILLGLTAGLLSACTRFLGTLPAPVLGTTPQAGQPTATVESPVTLPPVNLLPENRRVTVSEIVNAVDARLVWDAAFVPVTEGAVVGVGGQVRTSAGSRARLDLSGGTRIRLGPNALLTVEALTENSDGPFALTSLELGKIWVSLNGGSLQVVTPIGVASVRGSFLVLEYEAGNPSDPADDTLTLDCIEGWCSLQTGAFDEAVGSLQRLLLSDGGENLSRVALLGSDVQDFIENNPEAAAALPGRLTATVPAPTPAGTDVPSTVSEATPLPQAVGPTAVPILGRHTVRSGESLFCIGRAYGVLPGAIAEVSALDVQAPIFPGQTLLIPAIRWLNIPAGPVCRRQFESPFPAGEAGPVRIQIPVVIIAATPSPLATSTGAPTPAPTLAPTPVCPPPEYFDPAMNRCRIAETPRP